MKIKMTIIKKTYTVTNIKQLVDINGDITNFKADFSVKSLNNGTFDLLVIDQTTLDSGQNPEYKKVKGHISGSVSSDTNTYQNYFIILKADKPCDCEVVIDVVEVQPFCAICTSSSQHFLLVLLIMSMFSWFQSTCTSTVGDVVRTEPELISVDCHAKVKDVLDLLNSSHKVTVGVYGEAGHWLGNPDINLSKTFSDNMMTGDSRLVVGNRQYIGMVTILDIIAFVGRSSEPPEVTLDSKISDVIGSTLETQSNWIEPASRALFFAMEQFSRGVHHAFVIDETQKDAGPKMLAQSDIVRFLLSHSHAFPHVATLLQAPILLHCSDATVYGEPSERLISVLEKMLRHHGVPIVDSSMRVVSTLSASDLRGHLSTMVAFVAPMTVEEYIEYRTNGAGKPPVTINADATLQDAAELMLTHGIHRCFIQPSQPGSYPKVISYTDIIRAIFSAELPPSL